MNREELIDFYEESYVEFEKLSQKKKTILKSHEYDAFMTDIERDNHLKGYKSQYVVLKKKVMEVIKEHINLILSDPTLKSKFSFLQNKRL